MIDYRLASWSVNNAAPCGGRRFAHDTGGGADAVAGLCVVSSRADAGRIDELLAAGAEQVLLGESALQDVTLVTEAIARHGGERIGVWLPVHRAAARWGFDTTSNADFSVVSVTNPVPRWLVLQADRTPTDVDALWWAGQMAAAGCSTILVSVEVPEDDDLLACAEMAEIAAERFWLDPGSAETEELRFWLRYGQARRLVLPAGCDVPTVGAELKQRLVQDEAASWAG